MSHSRTVSSIAGAAASAPIEKREAPAREATAASISFITTEHFTLQGERSQTVSEATGRASMFLASVSGGLVALSLMATATKIGTAFYALALTVLLTLAFVGLVTFDRVLQNRVEDLIDANRIAQLRGFYFDHAPELDAYLLSVEPERRLVIQGLSEGPWQHFVTIAGMVSVITSVLAGSSAAVLVAVVSDHFLAGALVAGGVVAVAVLGAMMRYQNVVSNRLRRRAQQAFAHPRLPADHPRRSDTVDQPVADR